MKLVRSRKVNPALAAWTGTLLAASVAAAEPAFTGMQVQGNSDAIAEALDLADDKGALVRDVAFGGPAALAGVSRGDLIVTFNGKPVVSFEALLTLVAEVEAGDSVDVTVLRDGQEIGLTMKTVAKPPTWDLGSGAIAVVPSVGLTLASLTDRMRQRFRLRWSTVGVVISAVDRERLVSQDLNEGDVIVKVNQKDIWDPEQVVKHLGEAKEKGKEGLLLLIESPEGFKLLMLPVR